MENLFNLKNLVNNHNEVVGFIYTTLFCVAIACLLYFLGLSEPFSATLVISIAIGWSIRGSLFLGSHILNLTGLQRWLPLYASTILLAGVGTAMGLLVAGTVNAGQPFAYLGDNYAAMILGVFFAAIGLIIFESRNKLIVTEAALSKSDLIRQNQEKALLASELKLLQAQIEPHFLFNTLSNIISLIHTDPDAAEKTLLNFTTLLRSSLNRTRDASVTFGEELIIVKAYLEIQAIRMPNRLSYQFEPPVAELPMELLDCPLPPLLLQPIVENAVKHGIEPCEDGGQITIKMHINDGRVVIEVIDTGMGIGTSTGLGKSTNAAQVNNKNEGEGEGTGTGLNNVRGRLRALYGDTASLTVYENTPSGLRVQLVIPVVAS